MVTTKCGQFAEVSVAEGSAHILSTLSHQKSSSRVAAIEANLKRKVEQQAKMGVKMEIFYSMRFCRACELNAFNHFRNFPKILQQRLDE